MVRGPCCGAGGFSPLPKISAGRRDIAGRDALTPAANVTAPRYLIVTSKEITDVPEVFSSLPTAVMAKASVPLYRAFDVYR
jgi:hypothetical protein